MHFLLGSRRLHLKAVQTATLVPAALLLGALPAGADWAIWSGGGSSQSWHEAANWSNGVLPSARSDVLIPAASGRVVLLGEVVQVRSVQCACPLVLAGGSLTVTAGASTLAGLILTNTATLTVQGAGVSLVVTDSAQVDNASLYAWDGGVLRLPPLKAYTANYPVTLRASGDGSVLDLSAVTNITVSGNMTIASVQAAYGGRVDLSGLATVRGPLRAMADDGGVMVLGGRWSADPSVYYKPEIDVYAGAVVEAWLTRIDGANLYVQQGGTLILSNVTDVAIGTTTYWQVDGPESVMDLSSVRSIRVSGQWTAAYARASGGGRMDLGGLRMVKGPFQATAEGANSALKIDGQWEGDATCYLRPMLRAGAGGQVLAGSALALNSVSLEAYAGGVLMLSNLRQATIAVDVSWTADGPGSVLDLSSVTNISVIDWLARGEVRAFNGGKLDLSGLSWVHGPMQVWADGAGSTVVLAGQWSDAGDFQKPMWLWARGGGRITGTIFSLEAGERALELEAFGPGSVLDLSSVRWLTMPQPSGYVAPEARDGGRVDLSGLMGVAGPLAASAQGAGSVLSLGGAQWSYADFHTTAPQVWAIDGGQVECALANLDRVSLYAQGGSTLRLSGVTSVAPSQQLDWVARGVGSRLELPGLTNIAVANCGAWVNVQALEGGTVDLSALAAVNGPVRVRADGTNSLAMVAGRWTDRGYFETAPALDAYNGGQVQARLGELEIGYYLYWGAAGPGSELDLSSLTNISSIVDAYADFTASAGGRVDLSGLRAVHVPVHARAQGTNSTLRVAGQWSGAGPFGYQPWLMASDHAVLNAEVSAVDDVSLYVDSGAVLTLSNVTQITLGTYVDWQALDTNSLLDLSRLTNVAASNPNGTARVLASAGGRVDLSGLAWFATQGRFEANGAGSALEVSGLDHLVVANGQSLAFLATAGGRLDLERLASIGGAPLTILAQDPGSVIDLSSLAGLASYPYWSPLMATNGASLVLNEQGFLLANVSANAPGLLAAPSPQLTLYGPAWVSYLVESLDLCLPGADWQFHARVALTGPTQTLLTSLGPCQAFRVRQFEAPQPVLDMHQAEHVAQLVLFAPRGSTQRIEACPGFGPEMSGWQTWAGGSAVVMTNTFRILEVPMADQGFFRARVLP